MPFVEKDFLTVSDLNAQVRLLLEESFPEVAVLGEISNFKKHTSGHLYFTLKDAASQLRAVCFRGDAETLDTTPEDGIKVIATGRLTVYEPYGQYQLVAHSIRKVGVGELEIAFRALCEKLEKEGLFAPEHKQSLPAFPFRIAVITSRTGAAIRDIVSTLKRRWPCVDIFVFPVHVQGVQAAPEIIRALELVQQVEDLDLVVLGRGGGSLEDLWAFNEEAVARAVYACSVRVISAVGHETDFTITDFVADVRAATPTMAGEIAVPLITEVGAKLDAMTEQLVQSMQNRIELRSGRLRELLRSYALGRVRGRIEGAMQALDFSMEKLQRGAREAVEKRSTALARELTRLEALDPRAILARGFAVCSDMVSDAIVRSAAAGAQLKDMRVTFHDGALRTEVKERIDGKG
ncbi:MAG: exodeoxyribonuclease VII large subunit [Candidatus Latescibacteria bacterium]|nr:exodeoxyribonuclease VII large subunit [Candidatus Latescibacterota bacterium]NIM21520.1 exodeoxyribonuclease VII large subunit [Candidatus Latescibacterota bacterium]NIM65691.1 exodeoxyribonuclease VII large subunit [Candidatus Latescibacterota bacterium]NIO02073.1 exodeoxyribonuclease VII large subunit [Candidatus Latescibacterota bacterium]NIO28885.1 exodeoxyribonuclease VII large subunit [Candidatus Latescibacterota bacterium]